ncbi:MAG: hypothetical protein MUF49_29445 [Oculatellaceae cyanobacterium Prado106]|nr:hypothetical protein [Oculatellaceae cyanobacterium Prado106]
MLSGHEYVFDATQSTLQGNRIAIAYGRDVTDIALAAQFERLILIEMNCVGFSL